MQGCVAREIIPKLSQEYMAGKLSLEKLITHTMPLDKINEAFDFMFAGKRFVTKQIVAFTVNIISLSMLIGRLFGGGNQNLWVAFFLLIGKFI